MHRVHLYRLPILSFWKNLKLVTQKNTRSFQDDECFEELKHYMHSLKTN